MRRVSWAGKLVAILGVALVAAAGAAALPDNPYQRWQLIENTLYANATWSYERIHFDPRPIDVAILGASRSQMGLSAPVVAARLAALGAPLTVANLSVVEDGRNIEWAIADELFRAKHPRVVVVMIAESVSRWGHPGFKYVAPAAAVAAPPTPLLHNYLSDLAYLPYRQLVLFAARFAPGLFDLRDRFDGPRYAAKATDYSLSQTLADGKRIDMDRSVPAADLDAERRAFAASRHESLLPPVISRFTDVDNRVYVGAIARLAASHGARVIFVFLPEFGGATTIEDRAFYAARGTIADDGDLARDAGLFQSFSHLNRRGAVIASDRLADTIAAGLKSPAAARTDA
jgi:hypothetical protein